MAKIQPTPIRYEDTVTSKELSIQLGTLESLINIFIYKLNKSDFELFDIKEKDGGYVFKTPFIFMYACELCPTDEYDMAHIPREVTMGIVEYMGRPRKALEHRRDNPQTFGILESIKCGDMVEEEKSNFIKTLKGK